MTGSARQYLHYRPYQPHPHNLSPTSSEHEGAYIPYNKQFQRVSSIPSEKLAIEECDYSGFLPRWAELEVTEETPYASYIATTDITLSEKPISPEKASHKRSTNSTYLPRFQPPPQPQMREYNHFFCRECGCPLADRYGLHDLDDDDDWKVEYESCPTNIQTREWARSLEALRRAEEESRVFVGQERRRPRHLPKIDTAVSNRYRTGMQNRP